MTLKTSVSSSGGFDKYIETITLTYTYTYSPTFSLDTCEYNLTYGESPASNWSVSTWSYGPRYMITLYNTAETITPQFNLSSLGMSSISYIESASLEGRVYSSNSYTSMTSGGSVTSSAGDYDITSQEGSLTYDLVGTETTLAIPSMSSFQGSAAQTVISGSIVTTWSSSNPRFTINDGVISCYNNKITFTPTIYANLYLRTGSSTANFSDDAYIKITSAYEGYISQKNTVLLTLTGVHGYSS